MDDATTSRKDYRLIVFKHMQGTVKSPIVLQSACCQQKVSHHAIEDAPKLKYRYCCISPKAKKFTMTLDKARKA
jgi:hypothetical protein